MCRTVLLTSRGNEGRVGVGFLVLVLKVCRQILIGFYFPLVVNKCEVYLQLQCIKNNGISSTIEEEVVCSIHECTIVYTV